MKKQTEAQKQKTNTHVRRAFEKKLRRQAKKATKKAEGQS